MIVRRTAFSLLTFAIAFVCIGTPVARAQPTYGSPYGYVHDIPTFATNLTPAAMVEVGIWLEMLPSEPETTIRYEGVFGTLVVSNELTASGPSFNLVVKPVSADALMAECRSGQIDVSERILQRDAKGAFSIVLNSRVQAAPCSWRAVQARPVPPVQTYVCGPNNDRITRQVQPSEVVLASDTGWVGNQRTVQYVAAAGATLVGTGTYRFTDDPGRLCVSPLPTPPVIIRTPSAPTPLPILPTPRPWPTPRVTIVPLPTLPDTWTPSPYPPAPTPTPFVWFPFPLLPSWLPTPQPTTLTESPPHLPGSTEATRQTGEGGMALLTFAPAALVVGALALRFRRLDD